MAEKNKKKTEKKSRGRFSLELNFSRTLSLGAFVVLAMVWSFILGVFVGRGYNPEDVIPDIARIMPESERGSSESRILRPEELEFLDRLRSLPQEQRSPAPAREQTQTAAPHQPAIDAGPEPRETRVEVPGEEKFIYSYQVASFQTIQRATELQQRLMDETFTVSIADAFINNQPWYRVIVEFESPARDTGIFLKKLENQGITQPVFRGRRPS